MEKTFQEVFKKNFKEEIPQMVANFRFAFKQSDNFVTWIAGIDAIGITLIVGNSDKISNVLVNGTNKIIIIEFFLSILSTVIYKIMMMPLLGRWMQTELNVKLLTASDEDHEYTIEAKEDETKEFMDNLTKDVKKLYGLTDWTSKLIPDPSKKVYPRAFFAGGFWYLSIFFFIIGISIMLIMFLV